MPVAASAPQLAEAWLTSIYNVAPRCDARRWSPRRNLRPEAYSMEFALRTPLLGSRRGGQVMHARTKDTFIWGAQRRLSLPTRDKQLFWRRGKETRQAESDQPVTREDNNADK